MKTAPLFELHTHVEGSFSRELLFELRQPHTQESESEFQELFNYKDFREFLSLWWENQNYLFVLSDPKITIPKIANDFVRMLGQQGIIWCEAHISPIDTCMRAYGNPGFYEHANDYIELIKLWNNSFLEALCYSESPCDVRLIVDLVRNWGPECASWQQDLILRECKDCKLLLGFGLGGGSTEIRISDFKDHAERAKAEGLQFFAHAGEAPPMENACREVRDAISIGVTRIGHGINGFGKDSLLLIQDTGTPLEICITSNLKTEVISNLESHPAMNHSYWSLPITINSDDSMYFGNTLIEELKLLDRHHFVNALRNNIRFSCAPESLKSRALSTVEQLFSDECRRMR
jgi:adenosine deaminase